MTISEIIERNYLSVERPTLTQKQLGLVRVIERIVYLTLAILSVYSLATGSKLMPSLASCTLLALSFLSILLAPLIKKERIIIPTRSEVIHQEVQTDEMQELGALHNELSRNAEQLQAEKRKTMQLENTQKDLESALGRKESECNAKEHAWEQERTLAAAVLTQLQQELERAKVQINEKQETLKVLQKELETLQKNRQEQEKIQQQNLQRKDSQLTTTQRSLMKITKEVEMLRTQEELTKFQIREGQEEQRALCKQLKAMQRQLSSQLQNPLDNEDASEQSSVLKLPKVKKGEVAVFDLNGLLEVRPESDRDIVMRLLDDWESDLKKKGIWTKAFLVHEIKKFEKNSLHSFFITVVNASYYQPRVGLLLNRLIDVCEERKVSWLETQLTASLSSVFINWNIFGNSPQIVKKLLESGANFPERKVFLCHWLSSGTERHKLEIRIQEIVLIFVAFGMNYNPADNQMGKRVGLLLNNVADAGKKIREDARIQTTILVQECFIDFLKINNSNSTFLTSIITGYAICNPSIPEDLSSLIRY